MLKNLINSLKVLYSTEYPNTLTHMMQTARYRPISFFLKFWQTQDFSKVRNKQVVNQSSTNKSLLDVLQAGIVIQILVGLWLIYSSFDHRINYGWLYGLAVILAYPVLWPLLMVPVLLVRQLLRRMVKV
jgi:hypothetical protein